MSKEKVLIFDTTLRDGEQSAGAGLTVNDISTKEPDLEQVFLDITRKLK